MRMWLVNPNKMCRKHLLGEHLELHMFVGAINKGQRLDGYIKNRLLEIKQIEKRHLELVQEMLKRGYKHNSPLPEFNYTFEYNFMSVNIMENEKELQRRCRNCLFGGDSYE